MAEQLYLQLLTMEAEQLLGPALDDAGQHGGSATVVSKDDFDRCQELLLVTSWDGDLEEVKASRNMLSVLVKVPVPAIKASSAAGGPCGTGTRRAAVRDENASYGALLSDVSRGM